MTTISIDRFPNAIGTPDYVYDYVLAQLSQYGVDRVLDCPAGNGALAARLLEKGFMVDACDINDEQWKLGELAECMYADLNDRLPYEDGRYDSVVCLNGLHRVWARGRALGEMSRVLVKNGVLVITNVNNVNLAHRMAYLACGSSNYNTTGPPYGFLPEAGNPAALYRAPLTIADVLNVSSHAGLSVEKIDAIKVSWRSVALSPLALVSWAASLGLPRTFRKYCYVKESNGMAGMFADYTAIVLKKK